jgi:hypothetical protein
MASSQRTPDKKPTADWRIETAFFAVLLLVVALLEVFFLLSSPTQDLPYSQFKNSCRADTSPT